MGGERQRERLKIIRQRLRKKNISCLVVTRPANVTYTTGFSGGDSLAVITGRSVYLLTDSRYIEQAQGQCRLCRIIERTGPIAEATAKLIGKLKSVQTAAMEESASLDAFEALKKNVKFRLKSTAGVVESCRRIKDSDEISAIGTAGRIAAEGLKRMRRRLKPGVSENELAGVLDFEIRKLGGRNCFETIAAFGSNASRPHHEPAARRLKKNDCVLIDFGVRYKSYCCDLTRCFCLGRPSALYKKAYEAVAKAQAAAIKMVKAGVEIDKVDAAAREVIAGYGLPVYGHGTGHGLGLEVHELPVVSKNIEGTLAAGEVITIEPGVYIPGKLGVRIEDDVLVTESGCRILSGIAK